MKVNSLSRVRLCDPVDCNLPGSSVHGILQARILEWVAISSPGNLPDPGIEPMTLASHVLAGGFNQGAENCIKENRTEVE